MDYIKKSNHGDYSVLADEQIAELMCKLNSLQHDALVTERYQDRSYIQNNLNGLLATGNLQSISAILGENGARLQKEWGDGLGKGEALMAAKSSVSSTLRVVTDYIAKTAQGTKGK